MSDGNMSDGPHHTPAVPLERPSRLRPSWLRRLARTAVICLVVAIIAGRPDLALVHRGSNTALVDRGHVCAAAVHDACADAVHGELPGAAQVCEREFLRTQDPETDFFWAKALNEGHDPATARWIATLLLATPARSDALYLLGMISRGEDNEDNHEYALTAFEEAQKLHRIEQCPEELARDDGALAMVRTDRSEFPEALMLVDECIKQAQLAGDTSLEYYCRLTAAKTLIRVGYWSAAELEIEKATPLAASDDARSDLAYQRGSYEQERGEYDSAIEMFKNALQYGKHSQTTMWIINTELDLAYSLAEKERIDEAHYYLEDATSHDSDQKKDLERTWVAAQIAYRQHDLTGASSLTEDYFKRVDPENPVDRDDRIDVAILAARIELERDDLGRAERWARRGVELAERERGMQSVLELRPWVLAKRRAPHELLFTALARSGQVEAAAMAFDEWQGRTVQDALARPRPPAALDYQVMADQLTRLGEWLPVTSHAPLAGSPNRIAVVGAMQGIDLLALIVADDDVWRLTANHGPPQLSRLGRLAEMQDLVDEFRSHPTDVKLASALGTLLLQNDSFRETREVLHVLVDGQLGGLPVAALRHGATALIEMRPIVRVLRLPEIRCAHVTRSGAATVLAGPDDLDAKIPNARKEAEQVAELLHTTSKVGAAATSDALFAAPRNGVLHIAAHGAIRMEGAVLLLADREVSALEISARRLAPSLVVLSACDAATASYREFELAGSLVSGFLGAGAQHVVATLRPVTDAGALEISTRFYRNKGVADPARALAAVQSELAKTQENVDWPYFTVFGPDVCLGEAPDHP